jgi:hypothetical protein
MTEALIETDEPAGGDAGGGGDDGDGGAPGAGAGSRPRGATTPDPGARLWAWLGDRWSRLWAMPAASWVTLVVVAGCATFVLLELQIPKLLSDTTPTGGDMSAHVWAPAYLRDHLLTKGRLTGWSPDWYAGFPAFEFYMVPPFLAIALLSLVIPYGVAFKLVAVTGCVSLPVAVWAFGRLNRLPFPAPALMAIGATVFLFDRSYAIYGGNIASTLAGEFAFAISLSLAIVYLGLLGHVLRTGRHRGWAALVLGLAGLCHVIPFLFVVVGTVVWLIVRPGLARLADVGLIGLVGGLLMAWWFVPFYGRSAYLNDMGWTKLTDYQLLFQREITDSSNRNYPDMRYMVVGALIGVIVSIVMRQRAGIFLGALAAATALAFRFLPDGWRLWNARVLPFYYLLIDVLALLGLALIVLALSRMYAAGDRPLETVLQSVVVGGVTLAAYVYLALPMGALPFGHMNETGSTYEANYGPIHLATNDISYLGSWADWNFNGLEAWDERPEKDASGNETGKMVATYDRSYPEFHDLIGTLQRLAGEHGCGRAMWEYEEDHNRYGSTMEPMMLPFFTDGCIGSMEGLYFEASSTTPYHFINSTQLSKQGSAPQRELPYATMPPNQADFDQGVGHLKMLGVKYYLAIDDLMKERAGANRDLRRVADSGPWAIYLVAGSDLVEPLRSEPAVISGQGSGSHDWLDTSACWYVNEGAWSVPLVADGPDSWQRVPRTYHPKASESAQEKCSSPDGGDWGWLTRNAPESRALPEVKVSNIVAGDDGLSFDVDRPGVPVMVKMSYFPNWKVSGAQGPFRATPNLMVVIPESNHVELHYGYTALELFAYALSLVGIAGLVLLFRAPPTLPAPVSGFWAPVEDPDREGLPGAPGDAEGADGEEGAGEPGPPLDRADPPGPGGGTPPEADAPAAPDGDAPAVVLDKAGPPAAPEDDQAAQRAEPDTAGGPEPPL